MSASSLYKSHANENTGSFSSDGGGGIGGDMEARVAKLEAHVGHLQSDVKELRTDMKDVLARLVKIESLMATKAFVFSVYGTVSLVLAAIILFQSQIQTLLGVTPHP